MREIDISRIKVNVSERVSMEFLKDMKFELGETAEDYLFNTMTYKLWKYVICEERTQEKDIGYTKPATPWQFFKEKHFSDWMLKKYPVIYTHQTITVRFEERFMYPSLDAKAYKHNTISEL